MLKYLGVRVLMDAIYFKKHPKHKTNYCMDGGMDSWIDVCETQYNQMLTVKPKDGRKGVHTLL